MRALLAWSAVALSACATEEGRSVIDTGVGAPDVGLDTAPRDVGPEAKPPPEAGSGAFGTTCGTDDECDPLGEGDRFCTTRDPARFCASNRGCDKVLDPCLEGLGICMSEGGALTCRPRCTFAAGGPALGCLAGVACVPVSGADGYCFGGCVGACALGLCQRETGLCVGKLGDYARAPLAPCRADEGALCVCTTGASTKAGYCTTACLTGGGDGCVAGTACVSLGLDLEPAPTGLSGRCLKKCATEGDCVGLSSTCIEGTCRPV
ncbi:MAG: hypothetical protein JNL79_11945 [Myxococcales bacterium]|nr:hypothetical protein [Myxococcales bacterium]